jgi:dephospho-CoA kinase
VTGNIACGKSTVVDMLKEKGAVAIDADTVYHELIEPNSELWRALVARFGESIVGEGRRIDRRRLGRIVFADARALADLDRLTHPAVVVEIQRRLAGMRGGVVVVDAVKLIESGLDASCDQVWLVLCSPEQQVKRLMARNNLSVADARRRVDLQPDIEPKVRRADVTIDNSGTLADTARQVDRAWRDQVPPVGI